jgi:hypothetical protein
MIKIKPKKNSPRKIDTKKVDETLADVMSPANTIESEEEISPHPDSPVLTSRDKILKPSRHFTSGKKKK